MVIGFPHPHKRHKKAIQNKTISIRLDYIDGSTPYYYIFTLLNTLCILDYAPFTMMLPLRLNAMGKNRNKG